MPSTTFASLTTLRLGGPAEHFLTISTPANWADAVRTIGQRHEQAPVVLGHGSNVIASDSGHPGTVVVMNTRGITATRSDDTTVDVTVQAGHPLSDLIAWAATEHLAGIECLAGIPGTTGAAPVQNTGAYGQQVSDTLDHLTAWDWDMGRLRTLPAQACRLRHRDSRFKNDPSRWTILTATFRLTRSPASPITYQPLADELGASLGARPPVAEVTAAVLANRHRRGLLLDPHGPAARQAGSVFLNPPVTATQATRLSATGCPVHTDNDGQLRASAGWLLEHIGYRPGYKIASGIRCSERRTLTLTAHDGATSTGFAQALTKLSAQVEIATGVSLRPEPMLVGDWA
ncbi:UDP-N-acetylmuramate dehydrogenase [Streptomyces sp. CB01881]|uniref:UDP-N-acetylmuramate dehydrogenase n=1 Tax=Streptomyces sp. CB01881 TaxID=2078691 RepID=UPI000CDC3A03|nr:UDP-N-acetylmuramate dehydrogenase [Streptomyces sp. CB01881]AUY50953.1 UDP-N-acetylenolpyruvoylglucosamine reductase [Streptomyces sp. CB01881]TYC74338.1 UDP-N-acetylmuramate dehydrogenase [Streptomyces sp. CB01881]